MVSKSNSKDPKVSSNQTVTLKHHHDLKAMAYSSSLKKIRSKLPPGQKAFSDLTQAEPIDSLSILVSKTIARPNSLMIGSVAAFFGTLVTVYEAKHYGYPYNYFLIVYIFAAGYLVGLLFELLIKFLAKKK